jgi:hypothetical protein
MLERIRVIVFLTVPRRYSACDEGMVKKVSATEKLEFFQIILSA